jgi:hypothetical protein
MGLRFCRIGEEELQMTIYLLFIVTAVGIVFLVWSFCGLSQDISTAKYRKSRVLAHRQHA